MTMARQQADDELREFVRAAQKLAVALQDELVEWVNSVDAEKLSDDDALRFARLLRSLRERGALRMH